MTSLSELQLTKPNLMFGFGQRYFKQMRTERKNVDTKFPNVCIFASGAEI